jgi:hypothetical protein
MAVVWQASRKRRAIIECISRSSHGEFDLETRLVRGAKDE